jgi:hypothetical protein
VNQHSRVGRTRRPIDNLEKYLYRYLTAAVLVVIGSGTVFYHLVEKFSWLNAYYFSVTTLSTVGYGDLTPKTTAGKLFTTFYIFLGVGIFTSFLTLTIRRRGAALRQRRGPGNPVESG